MAQSQAPSCYSSQRLFCLGICACPTNGPSDLVYALGSIKAMGAVKKVALTAVVIG
jgi:hypothetical protein